MKKRNMLLALGLACLPAFSASALDQVETRAHYSTNPGDAVGRSASITIDGEFTDWSDDMIIATCGANDVATAFKGSHENCVLDLYAVYAAWDDKNLYIAWQMCNTGDTWARPGDGPLTDGGRIGDVPLIVALSIDPASTPMSGKLTDGRFIWGDNAANGVQFSSHVDRLFFMSGKPGLGDPSMFRAVDAAGNTNYGDGCTSFRSAGISYKMKEGFAPSHLWRQNTTAEWSTPTDLVSDPSVLNNIYDPECYDNLMEGTPSGLKDHDTTFDSFYELCIPLSCIGIDRAWLEANGIGCRVVATRGESGLDCCPFDPSMVDNTFGEYGKDNSTTHEKDDIDIITYALASVGKMRTGSVDPLPYPDPDPIPGPDPDPTPVLDGNYTIYYDNTDTGWGSVMTWIWDAADGNKNFTGGTWPGAAMVADTESGYYKYTFKCEAENPDLKCIFSSGGTQTDDLDLHNNGIYTFGGFTGKYYTSSVAEIEVVADSVAEYYTLQGMRVAGTPSTGIYLRRTAGHTEKVYIR